MSTIKVNNLQNASAASPAFVLAADGSATANLSSVNGGPIAGSRNRIINGDMRIDQRNAGASVTPTTDSYTIDRWAVAISQASKFSIQQNAGSITPPAGFSNYLGITSLSAYSVGASDYFRVAQAVEGFNISDLAWGTASASAVTVSFWVRSSLTGTFGAQILNGAGNRIYPFTYTISAANTWENKSVSIPGDTTGTWSGNNSVGLYFGFSLGYGSSLSGAANAWNAGTHSMPTGATSVVGTSGATFYITGVQLEPGSTATPFERRSFGQELALAQRYYAKTYAQSTVPGTATDSGAITSTSQAAIAYASAGTWQFPVTMRATPTVTIYSTNVANTTGKVSADSVDGTGVVNFISDRNAFLVRLNDSTGVGANVYIKAHAIASAEL